MNHNEIVEKTLEMFNRDAPIRLPESAVREVIKSYTDALFMALVEGHRIALRDIGRLEVTQPEARVVKTSKGEFEQKTFKNKVKLDISTTLDRVINPL